MNKNKNKWLLCIIFSLTIFLFSITYIRNFTSDSLNNIIFNKNAELITIEVKVKPAPPNYKIINFINDNSMTWN